MFALTLTPALSPRERMEFCCEIGNPNAKRFFPASGIAEMVF